MFKFRLFSFVLDAFLRTAWAFDICVDEMIEKIASKVAEILYAKYSF